METKFDPFGFAELEDHIVDGEFKPPMKTGVTKDTKNIKFPCQVCNGTGYYQGVRIHQPKEHCFACRGRGYFLTSERDREEARGKRVASKAKKQQEAVAAFDEQHPGIRQALQEYASWSEFAANLLSKLNQYGSLFDNQVAAIRKMMATVEAKKVAKASGNAVVDLSAIRKMFDATKANHGKTTYRAEGLVLSLAPDHGRNPGAIYVKTEADEYLGKIIGTSYTGKAAPALQKIAADPLAVAIAYGKKTNHCACCGLLLENPLSVKLGIGPICRQKWGL